MNNNIYTVGNAVSRPPLSIFLAGPIERRKEGQNPTLPQWRKEALNWLDLYSYDNHNDDDLAFIVYNPEWDSRPKGWSYHMQVDWEIKAMHQATAILCWVPRQLPELPAFTTNVEVGEWLHNPKLIIGAPPDAPHTRYIRYRKEKLSLPWCTSLESCSIETTRFLRRVKDNE